MQTFHMTAVSKKHFEDTIKDHRQKGYMIVTYTPKLCEMEKPGGDVLIVIERGTTGL